MHNEFVKEESLKLGLEIIKCKKCGLDYLCNAILRHLRNKECGAEYSEEEKKALKKNSRQSWYKTNREYLLERMSENYQSQKSKICNKNQEYYQKNQKSILEQKKNYYQENKETIKPKKNAREKRRDVLGYMGIEKASLEKFKSYLLKVLNINISVYYDPIKAAKIDFRSLKTILYEKVDEKVTKILEEFENLASEKKKEIMHEVENVSKLADNVTGDYTSFESEDWKKVAIADRNYIECLYGGKLAVQFEFC